MGPENSTRHDQPTDTLGKEPVEFSLGEARSCMRIKTKKSIQHSFRPTERTCVSRDGCKESVGISCEVRSLSEIFVSDELPPLPCELPNGNDTECTAFSARVYVDLYGTGAGWWVPEAEIACISRLRFCHFCRMAEFCR